jgi:hypothetical protein
MNPKDKQEDIATDVAYIDPESTEDTLTTPPKRKRGRPKKTEVAAKKKGSRGQVGRPKGDAAIMNEYKARMLNSPKSRRVLETIFDAALDDEHKNQGAAWKLIMDRLLPAGMFEQEVSKGSQRNAVNITISGVGGESINIGATAPQQEEEILEGEYKDVN